MEDVLDECSHILADMRRSAHEYLLKPVHEALKVSNTRARDVRQQASNVHDLLMNPLWTLRSHNIAR